MTALAALVFSLATAAAPALDDPGAGARAPLSASAETKAASTSGDGEAGGVNHPSAATAPTGGIPIVDASTIDASMIDASTIAKAAHPGKAAAVAGAAGASSPAESGHGFPTAPILPILGFALCGGAALVFARRKQQLVPKMLEIVETHALGGRRSLIVARIAGETVLLGASEAGLSLLLARPGETVAQARPEPGAKSNGEPAAAPAPTTAPSGALGSSWLGKLRLARSREQSPEAKEPSFEALLALDAAARARPRSSPGVAAVEPALLRQPLDPLAESAEDQELRRKLAQGRAGRIA